MTGNRADPGRVNAPMRCVRSVFLLAVVATVVSACADLPFPLGGTPPPPAHAVAQGPGQDPYVEALQAWQATGIHDYTWQLDFACECGLSGPNQVTVVDGKVTKVVKPSGPVPLDQLSGVPLTVDGLLQEAITVSKAGGAVGATWPGDNGVPSELHIDPKQNTIDDELDVAISNFQPTP